MRGPRLAVLVIEIGATVAVQASGIGGPGVMAGALALVLLTAGYLLMKEKRGGLVLQLRSFVAERRAAAPSLSDSGACREYELDTLDCFRRRHAPAVRRRTRRLRERGLIGWREERRLNSPCTVGDIEELADRLAGYEGLLRR
ncbi:MAG TPA: hypothetical protein VGI76_09520 [Solirubrobacteraceae bacterium]